jgi:hypothetical protein
VFTAFEKPDEPAGEIGGTRLYVGAIGVPQYDQAPTGAKHIIFGDGRRAFISMGLAERLTRGASGEGDVNAVATERGYYIELESLVATCQDRDTQVALMEVRQSLTREADRMSGDRTVAGLAEPGNARPPAVGAWFTRPAWAELPKPWRVTYVTAEVPNRVYMAASLLAQAVGRAAPWHDFERFTREGEAYIDVDQALPHVPDRGKREGLLASRDYLIKLAVVHFATSGRQGDNNA